MFYNEERGIINWDDVVDIIIESQNEQSYLKNEILEEYAQGKSIRELSVKYGYTERRIRQIVQLEKK